MTSKLTVAIFITACLLGAAGRPRLCAGSLDELVLNADAMFSAQNYKAAEKDYKKILDKSPSDLKTRFKYSQTLFFQKKYQESIAQINCVLQNAPNNIAARVLLAKALTKLNKLKEAQTQLEWALKLQPEHAKAKKLLNSLTKPAKQAKPADKAKIKHKNKTDKTAQQGADSPKGKLPKTIKQTKAAPKATAPKAIKPQEPPKAISSQGQDTKPKAISANQPPKTKKSDKPLTENKKSAKQTKTSTAKDKDITGQTKASPAENKELAEQAKPSPAQNKELAEQAKTSTAKDKDLTEQAKTSPAKNKELAEQAKVSPAKNKKAASAKLKGSKAAAQGAKPKAASAKGLPQHPMTKPQDGKAPSARPQSSQAAMANKALLSAPQMPLMAGEINKNASRPEQVKVISTSDKDKITDFSYEAFIKTPSFSSSFFINAELAKFYLENADYDAAKHFVDVALKLSEGKALGKKKLEVKVLDAVISTYKQNYNALGSRLAEIKPLLPASTYESLLSVYNKGLSLKTKGEKARLAAGLAMSLSHFAAAEQLINSALKEFENDIMLLAMLSQAQLQNFNYSAAEQTLIKIYNLDNKSPEAAFNLARFYLTVFYRPKQAETMIKYAKSLAPNDSRLDVLNSLLCYSKGQVDEGISQMKAILPQIKNETVSRVCRQIIADGELQKQTNMSAKRFRELIALPGAPHAPISSYSMVGEDYLARESFISAIRFFNEAKDGCEASRAYLALSYALKEAKEDEAACITADYATQLLRNELLINPKNSKACLYSAMQCASMQDSQGALIAAEQGLKGDADETTRERLNKLYESLKSKTAK